MKIVVLCGGLSNERDVSITSGSCVARSLRERGHSVVLLDMFLGYGGDCSDPTKLFDEQQQDLRYSVGEETPDIASLIASGDGSRLGKNVISICRAADIVFLALHGEDGEDGKIQATLDMYGVKYTGSGYLGSALAMNKELSKTLFNAAGIPTAPAITLRKGEGIQASPWIPCVVKPCSGGSSVGTSIVRTQEEFSAALEFAFKYEDDVLVEKYIKGRELTVGVMDGKAMPSIEIVLKNGWYDYKNKYQAGFAEEICPAPISAEDEERLGRLAERVSKALMVDVYCRADFIMDDDDGEIYCLEANTLPGMTPTSLVPQMAAEQGMSYGELCEKIITLSMRKYDK
ncbi:MAG: D-alanine--D-alanine ligase [Clostridia bacterium]|nr:D-alanine--D-alanine ligase [Clostridiales bacterium]MDO4354424.1 D-alanine--D-alanine ligase [Clostridia bacterium]